jgi:hypothetical protein
MEVTTLELHWDTTPTGFAFQPRVKGCVLMAYSIESLADTLAVYPSITKCIVCQESNRATTMQPLVTLLAPLAAHLRHFELTSMDLESDAMGQLIHMLRNCPQLNVLRLQCAVDNPVESLSRFTEYFATIAPLEKVELQNFTFAELHTANLANGFCALQSSLQELVLCNVKSHTLQLPTSSMAAIAKCHQLRVLKLDRVPIAFEAWDLLGRGLGQMPHLRELYVSRVAVDWRVFYAGLCNCTNLHILNLDGTHLNPTAIADLARILPEMPMLCDLGLASMQVGIRWETLTPLVEVLPRLSNLTSLNIASNRMNTQTVSAMAEAIQSCPRLLSLNLKCSIPTPEGMKAIVAAVNACTRLQSLNIEGLHINIADLASLVDFAYSHKQLYDLRFYGISATPEYQNHVTSIGRLMTSRRTVHRFIVMMLSVRRIFDDQLDLPPELWRYILRMLL